MGPKTNILQEKIIKTGQETLQRYIKNISIMNTQTANEYYVRLLNFERFLESLYGPNISIDNFVYGLKKGKFNVYDTLGDYCVYLQNSQIYTTTLKQRIVTAKNFLEYNDIDISPRKFKIKIRLPKDIKRNKEAIDKHDIINILNGCSDIKLKTYVMFLASTGMRAVEALSIRIKDLDFESMPARVTIRGEYTKTKVDRYVFLTKEMTEQFKKWLDYKYRTRRVCKKDQETGRSIDEYRTPEKNVNDLLFSVRKDVTNNNSGTKLTRSPRSKPQSQYYYIVTLFQKTLDRIGAGSREEYNENRRKITFHTFRRFVKTTISDLGYSDYSEWFIGHAGSTYWRKKDTEKAELYKKIEPYLTF
ncbi:MAG TPA: tyrosine-type recombinase/integrase, partial [Nitrososphaeraceae archaeon]|nr:tyrosine-type recombinase/integrase [Nitrososphaeraceae archaeon]